MPSSAKRVKTIVPLSQRPAWSLPSAAEAEANAPVRVPRMAIVMIAADFMLSLLVSCVRASARAPSVLITAVALPSLSATRGDR